MTRFLNKIADMLADAALPGMGVNVQTTAEPHSKASFESGMSRLKRFLQNLTDTLADAAMLEMGVNVATPAATAGTVHESLEENLIEVAFAEAADYDDIHEAILREHRSEQDIAHPDDCQYGDNDLCFA
jgi:glutamate dehydrogenase/leucine dehydrogenase